MKQRLLVMNGQKLVQNEVDGKWKTVEVTKAPGLKAGIYNIYTFYSSNFGFNVFYRTV